MRTLILPAVAALAIGFHSARASEPAQDRVYVDVNAYALTTDHKEAIYVPIPRDACVAVTTSPDTGANVVIFAFDDRDC